MNILGKGISLTDIGVNSYAYSWEHIDDVLSEIEKLSVTVLGGDVYLMENSGLVLTFDSWYYSLLHNDCDYILSIDKAREYIQDYLEKNGTNYYFSLVFS